MRREEIVQRLADAEEPSIRWKIRVGVLDEDPKALDLLEQKELPTGGWSADDRYFKVASKPVLGGDYVNWGSSKTTMNEWITADALTVLHAAGRL